MNENIIIDLQGVNKTFNGPAGPIEALKKVFLKVYPGEFVGVRGPSGSGKSTLINMITGIDRPTEGALYEALYRLRARESGTLVFLTGEGEGRLERTDEPGYSGLAAALSTEGYRLRRVVSAAMSEVPAETRAVVVLDENDRVLYTQLVPELGREPDYEKVLAAAKE